MYNHHHSQFRTFSSPQKETLNPLGCYSPNPPSSSLWPQAIWSLCSVYTFLSPGHNSTQECVILVRVFCPVYFNLIFPFDICGDAHCALKTFMCPCPFFCCGLASLCVRGIRCSTTHAALPQLVLARFWANCCCSCRSYSAVSLWGKSHSFPPAPWGIISSLSLYRNNMLQPATWLGSLFPEPSLDDTNLPLVLSPFHPIFSDTS